MDISISKRKKWAWSHLEVTYVPLVTRLYAVIKTMWRMQIQLLCVSVLYSMGSRVKPCPNMGIVTSHKSHGWNARFWLVERKFAALWLVSTPRGHYHYSYFGFPSEAGADIFCSKLQEIKISVFFIYVWVYNLYNMKENTSKKVTRAN